MTVAGYTTTEPLPGSGTTDDRALRAFRDLVRSILPQLALLGVWEYHVDSVGSGTVSCSPLDTSLGLPGAVTATLWPSILGERVTPSVGSRVLLGFVNGDAGRPVVLAGDPSTPPTVGTIGGTAGVAGIARTGDGVAPGSLRFVPGSGGAALYYTPDGGAEVPVTTGTTMAGHITGGSATAKAGA